MDEFSVGVIKNESTTAPPETDFSLRPLTTGQVLDRSFTLYRMRFWLFAGLAAPPAAITLIFQLSQLWYLHTHHTAAPRPRYSATVLLLSLTSALLSFIAGGLTVAATTRAVTYLYLGRDAAISVTIRETLRHWFRYVLVVFAQFISAGWVTFLLLAAAYGLIFSLRKSGLAWIGGLVFIPAVLSFGYFIWRYLQVSLAMPASVFEDLNPLQSIRRSKALLPDRKVRIFLLWLLLSALYVVLIVVLGAFGFFVRTSHLNLIVSQIVNFSGSFFGNILIGPIGAIAICLFYFDERVRREGFDLEYLLQLATPAEVVSVAEVVPGPVEAVSGEAVNETGSN